MRIGLAYDLQPDDMSTDRWAEWDRPETVDGIEQALRALGHAVQRVGSAHEMLGRLDEIRRECALVFSIAEGAASRTREAWVPTLCEMIGLPYVGSSPQTLALALDKWMTRRLWQAEGLPVPTGANVSRLADVDALGALPFPLIVKPRYEGSGMGIDADAIVSDRASLHRRVAWAIAAYQEPVVIEAFIRGGEFTVCLVGDPLRALPPVQRHVDPTTTLSCHIAQRRERRDTVAWQLPCESTTLLDEQLQRLALRAATVLGCRDLARVDVRVTPEGQPHLLEINPLPSLDSDSTFVLLADVLGWGFPGMLQRIIEPAIDRATSNQRPAKNSLLIAGC